MGVLIVLLYLAMLVLTYGVGRALGTLWVWWCTRDTLSQKSEFLGEER